MPAYNVQATVGNIVRKCLKYSNNVVVFDDGSTDGTYQESVAAGAHVIKSPVNRGYGVAIKSLFRYAKEEGVDIMITIDSDSQHDPDEIPILIDPIVKDDVDIVIGSRFLKRSDKEKVPRYRSFGIKTITRLAQALSYTQLTDAQSGFRAYGREAMNKIDIFEGGMAVSTEILLRGKENSLIVKEAPISVKYDVENSSTHNPLAHGVGVLHSVLRFMSVKHPLTFYGLPGIVLLMVSIYHANAAMELFSTTRFISTNMILVSVGSSIVGVVMLATGVILYTLTALLNGRIR